MSLIWGRVDLATANKFKTILQMQVYTVLSSFQGGKKSCFPSLQAISDRMTENGIVSRTGEPYKIRRISQVIKELRELGLIKTKRVGLGRSNIYEIGIIEKLKSGISFEENRLETGIQSRVHRGESRVAYQARESYRKEHLKRTPEKNPEPIPQIRLEARYWQRKEREKEEKRLERENYMKSCEEAQGMILSRLRERTG